jgi:hypothetical protein
VRSEVLVSLLVSVVFGDEVEVFSADDESSVHLGGHDSSGQDTATNGDETGERALLVCGTRMLAINSPSSFKQEAALPSMRMQAGPSHPIPSISGRLEHEMRCNNQLRVQHYLCPRNPHTDVGALNRGLWCPEAQPDVLVPSSSILAGSARLGLRLGVEEDVRLLLESALRLHGKFGGHGCGCGAVVVEIASRGGLGFAKMKS